MSGNERDQHIPIEDLSTYADGEIRDPADLERIEGHLAVCAFCRDELAELQTLSSLLADLPEPELPRSFRLTAADVAPKPVPIQPWIVRHQAMFRYAGLAAVLLLAVVITVDLLPSSTTNDADEVATFMQEEPSEDAARETDEQEEMPEIMTVDDEESAVEQDTAGEDETLDAEQDTDVPVAEEEAAPDVGEEADSPEADVDRDEEHIEDSAADLRVEEEDPADQPETDTESTTLSEAPPEDGELDETPVAAEETEDGLTPLRIAAISLGVLSVSLLVLGFAVPRWWQSPAN